jgi:hypothetical protein
MLYALGPLTFEIAPVNAHEINHVTEASYVEKPVVGRRPPLEFTGDGPEEITVAAKLLPPKFGGLSSLGMLDQMRQSGVPHVFVRGDGAPLGWFCVDRAREQSTYLDSRGVGKVIEVDITLKRADAPGAAGYMSALLSLLG